MNTKWIENLGYGPQDQPYPEGTPIEIIADQIVVEMDNDMPGCANQISAAARLPEDLEYPFELDIPEECADALETAIDSLDADRDGNYLFADSLQALFDAVNARAGAHFIEENTMRITESKLRQILKNVILEYGAPGIGGQGNDMLGSEISHPKGPSIGNRGLGWADFQALAQDGDYAAAGRWLQQYCGDRGYLCNREIENHLISIAQDEYVSGSDLQDELMALLDHFANE